MSVCLNSISLSSPSLTSARLTNSPTFQTPTRLQHVEMTERVQRRDACDSRSQTCRGDRLCAALGPTSLRDPRDGAAAVGNIIDDRSDDRSDSRSHGRVGEGTAGEPAGERMRSSPGGGRWTDAKPACQRESALPS